jgi:hypothetical protein
MLTLILPRLVDIASTSSNIKLVFDKFAGQIIDEPELVQDTKEMKKNLVTRAKQLVEVISVISSGDELAKTCLELAKKIETQSGRISRSLCSTPVNSPEVSDGIDQINRALVLMESRLCSYYDETAATKERERLMMECYKKALDSIRRCAPPIFEDNFDEYKQVAEGINIEYSQDGRSSLNRKMSNLPGIIPFLTSLENIPKRNRLLNLIKEYDETDPTSIHPLPQEIASLLPCIRILEFLGFSSEEELKSDFIKFFKDGNWLEIYIFLMLERAGCSTRLLNTNILHDTTSLEADVLALSGNRLFVFDAKDRIFSEGLTESDVLNITQQLDKIGTLPRADIEMIYVINIDDAHRGSTKTKIEEISSSKGTNAKILFLDNIGQIDNLPAKIRESLR